MLRLRHLVIRRYPSLTGDRVHEWIGHLASEDEVADLLYCRFSRFRGAGLLAMQGEDAVGFCGWQQDEGFAFLGPVIVRPDKRRWGGATHLIELSIDEMRVEGVRTIESAFPCGDPAGHGMFARCGFRTRGADGTRWTRVERTLNKTK